ncbi:PAS domain S-box protein [Bacillus sp. 3255]|uniref:PAS domain S-box protein n=1 Tax=Bacillus sp. 3255 TaxID=2817904 RepID=UPI0028593327|nr:PAS domain S-box protein [Bacillus sp. 3255]MDR6882004.1 two-component system sporulation sensor kinase A [Bacillus sp. 3255]
MDKRIEREVLQTDWMHQINQLFEVCFYHTNASVAITGLDHRVLKVNQAYEHMYGWTNSEIYGKQLIAVPSDEAERVKSIHLRVAQGDCAQCYETLMLRKNGDAFHASITVSPLKDAAGTIFALAVVARDISERKRKDEKLRKSEERYRNLVELSPEPIIVYGESVITYVNPAALKLVGAEAPEQLLGSIALDFIHPDEREEMQAQIELILRERHFSDVMEKRLLRLDQQVIDVEIRAVPIEYLGKSSIQLLCRDITHKKVMESIVRERDEEYRRMMMLLPEPIVVHQEGIICYVNDIGMKLLGAQAPDELIGKSVYDFVHPDHYERVTRRIKEVVLMDNFIPFIEVNLLGLHGEHIEVEASSVVLHSYLDRPVIQTVLRDITERKVAEEMLRQSEKLSVVGQLAAGIAHEIRNPLTSLVGFLQLIKSAAPTKVVEYADIMLVELNRINTIVNEFMLIAKPQSSRFAHKSVCDILENVISLLEPQALLHNVNIHFVYSRNSAYLVNSDEGQLKQVFINLIKNSVEAMPAGGSIRVVLQPLGHSRLTVKIIDTGAGIPDELLPRLGDPFFTTKEEGTGLGLMVCYRIIEAHQGTMKILSKLDAGTTVEIELPRI